MVTTRGMAIKQTHRSPSSTHLRPSWDWLEDAICWKIREPIVHDNMTQQA